MALLDVIDAAAPERVLVFGSLPPQGRDLDLLVPAAALPALAAALADDGFEQRGVAWARFADCTAEGVDLVEAESWRLPQAELDALFAEAEPLPGRERVVAPSPHHTLLLLARQLGRGPLPEKRRRRLEAAVARDADAWRKAQERASAWALDDALERLRVGGGRLPARPRRGHVIALSGLDGSGKSTQARHLEQALGRLGLDVVVVWTPLANNASLRALARPVKRALRLLARRGLGGDAARRTTEGASLVAVPDAGEPATPTRRALTLAWATVVALVNALALVRRAAPHLAQGRVVVFDRYVLDSTVHLRYLYGDGSYRLQETLLRLLAARPAAAFFLDVAPETVAARKPLQYDLDQLHRQSALYHEHCARLGVVRVDGEQDVDEVCRTLARAAWLAVTQ